MVEVSFRCDACGTTLTWPDNAPDDYTVTCSNCCKIAGTYGDLRDAAEQAVRRKIDGILGQDPRDGV